MSTARLLFVCGLLLAPQAAPAHPYLPGEPLASYHTGAYQDAFRDWELATFDQRRYQRIDHPMLIRRLRADIAVTAARICVLEDRLEQYRPFNGFRQGNALTLTIEETRVALLRERLHLRELRTLLSEERRAYSLNQRYLVYEAHRAAAELAVEAEKLGQHGVIEIVTHEE